MTGRTILTHAALIVAAVLVGARYLGVFGPSGGDFAAYWRVDLADPYADSVANGPSAFLYSPLFAQALEPLRWLPFDVALALWTALELACLVYLAGPWALALFLPFGGEWMNGNVHLVMAAAVYIALRHPVGWAVPVFTKLSPGVGLLWFVFRRDWGYVVRSVGLLAVLFVVSFLLSPQAWFDWIRLLVGNVGVGSIGFDIAIPLIIRVPVALLVLAWAARTNRTWPVPLACALCLPVLWWAGLIAFSLAALRLLGANPPHAERDAGKVRRDLEAAAGALPGDDLDEVALDHRHRTPGNRVGPLAR